MERVGVVWFRDENDRRPDSGKNHEQFQGKLEAAHHQKKEGWSYKEARDAGAKSQKAVNPQCSEECTKAQLDAYHKKECGARDNTRLRTDPHAGTRSQGELDNAQQSTLDKEVNNILGNINTSSRK